MTCVTEAILGAFADPVWSAQTDDSENSSTDTRTIDNEADTFPVVLDIQTMLARRISSTIGKGAVQLTNVTQPGYAKTFLQNVGLAAKTGRLDIEACRKGEQ